MPTTLRPRPMVAALVASFLVALGAAGCGSSASGGADADPAAVAPAAGALYLEAVVRPQGDERARADAVLGRILHTNDVPGLIHRGIDKLGRSKGLSYARDVDPWLGNRIALYVANIRPGGGGSSSADIAAIAATKDADKANAFLDKTLHNAPTQTYRDVSYRVSGGAQVGVVDGYLVVATPSAFRQVVDTSMGSQPKLSDADAYKRARGLIATGALATFYLDPGRLLNGLASSSALSGSGGAALAPALSQLHGTAVGAAVRALSSGFELEAASTGGHMSKGVMGDAAGAVRGVPADSWLAVGIGAIGSRVTRALRRLNGSQGLNGINLDTLLSQARQQTGIDIPHDLLSWMGDGAVFVRGTSGPSVGGALVVRSTDPALTRSTIRKIGAFVRRSSRGRSQVAPLTGVPGVDTGLAIRSAKGPEVDLALAGSRFVLAVRRDALRAVVRPGATLGDAPRFRSAAATLGGLRPSFFFDIAPVLRLAQSTSSYSSRGFRSALPYLRAFTTIVAGAGQEGGVSRTRLVLGVR